MGRGGESFVGAKEDERKRHVFGREGRKGREEGSSATTHARRKLVLRGRHLRPGRENIDRGGGTERLEQVERKGHCFALAGDHLFLQAGRPQARVPCHGASLVKEGRSRKKTPRSSYYLL